VNLLNDIFLAANQSTSGQFVIPADRTQQFLNGTKIYITVRVINGVFNATGFTSIFISPFVKSQLTRPQSTLDYSVSVFTSYPLNAVVVYPECPMPNLVKYSPMAIKEANILSCQVQNDFTSNTNQFFFADPRPMCAIDAGLLDDGKSYIWKYTFQSSPIDVPVTTDIQITTK
jgi:hypothetical protein